MPVAAISEKLSTKTLPYILNTSKKRGSLVFQNLKSYNHFYDTNPEDLDPCLWKSKVQTKIKFTKKYINRFLQNPLKVISALIDKVFLQKLPPKF